MSRTRISLIAVIGFAVLFLCSCNSGLKPGMISLNTTPSIDFQKTPDLDSKNYSRFALLEMSGKIENSKMNPIIEKQLLFMVRNNLEFLGYKFEENPDKADILVSLIYSNELSASNRVVPWYVPGQTYNSNFSAYGSSGYVCGTARTRGSGTYVPVSVHRTNYYPSLTIGVLDSPSREYIWTGSVVAATQESDVRRSANTLLLLLVAGNYPHCKAWVQNCETNNGIIGFGFQIFTIDGNNYYPMVTGIWKSSPAEIGGLRVYDIIKEIDGISTLNKSFSEVRTLLDKNAQETISISYQRDNQIKTVVINFEDEFKIKLSKCTATNFSSGYVSGSLSQVTKSFGIQESEALDIIP